MLTSHKSIICGIISCFYIASASNTAKWEHLGPFNQLSSSTRPARLKLADIEGKVYIRSNDSLYRSDNKGGDWKSIKALTMPWRICADKTGNLYTISRDSSGQRKLYTSHDRCTHLLSYGNRIVHINQSALSVSENCGLTWDCALQKNLASAVGAGNAYFFFDRARDNGGITAAVSVNDYALGLSYPLPGSLPSHYPPAIAANKSGQVCCITENGPKNYMCVSLDSGRTWSHQTIDVTEVTIKTAGATREEMVYPSRIFLKSEGRIYATSKFGVMASDDFGATWPVFIQTYPGFVRDIVFDNHGRTLVLMSSEKRTGVFLLDEVSNSFSRVGGSITGNDLHIDSDGNIYVAGPEGISRLSLTRLLDSSFVHLTAPQIGDRLSSMDTTVTVQVLVSGNCRYVEYYSGANLIGTATTAPYSFTWQNPPIGEHSLTARMVTTDGRSVTSAPVVITVGNTNSVVNGFAGPMQRVMLRAIGRGRIQLTVRAERQFRVRAFDSKGRLVISEQGRGNLDRILRSPSGFLHFVVEHDGKVFRRKMAIIN